MSKISNKPIVPRAKKPFSKRKESTEYERKTKVCYRLNKELLVQIKKFSKNVGIPVNTIVERLLVNINWAKEEDAKLKINKHINNYIPILDYQFPSYGISFDVRSRKYALTIRADETDVMSRLYTRTTRYDTYDDARREFLRRKRETDAQLDLIKSVNQKISRDKEAFQQLFPEEDFTISKEKKMADMYTHDIIGKKTGKAITILTEEDYETMQNYDPMAI